MDLEWLLLSIVFTISGLINSLVYQNRKTIDTYDLEEIKGTPEGRDFIRNIKVIFLLGGFFALLIALNPLLVDIYTSLGGIYDGVISFYEKPDLDHLIKNIGFIGIFIGFSTFSTFIISLVYKYRKENNQDILELMTGSIGVAEVVFKICISVLIITLILLIPQLIGLIMITSNELQLQVIGGFVIVWVVIGLLINIVTDSLNKSLILSFLFIILVLGMVFAS